MLNSLTMRQGKPAKVQHDEYYLHLQSFGLDFHILALTIIRVVRRSGLTY
jgi:lipopolysaccharide/colanic/teichoic acid biosynthesis glycosyltransferase